MRPEILTACDHLLAAMMNGVWQGMVITALVAFGLRILRQTNAATRHAVWFVTLMLLAAITPAHALRDYLSRRASASELTELPRIGRAGAGSQTWSPPGSRLEPDLAGTVGEAQELGPESRIVTADAPGVSQPAAADFVVPFESSLEPSGGRLVGLTDPSGQLRPASTALDVNRVRRAVTRFLSPGSWNLTITAEIPRTESLILLAVWFFVAGMRFALLFRGVHKVRGLKRASVPPSMELAERFRALCQKLNVDRNVVLRISSTQRSPIVLGFIRPVILFPSAEANASKLTESEHILSHELAHAQRRDDWANLVQHLVQAALFFHPAVWWISKRMVIEREIACDDWVLQQGTRPRDYALLLADLAG